MATENKASFIVDLKGNVSQKARTFGSDISAMSNKGSLAMRGMSNSTNFATQAFSAFSRTLLGFASAGIGISAGKTIIDLQEKIKKTKTEFNLTEKEASKLNSKLWKTATNHSLEFDDLFKPATKILERTNNYKETVDNLDNIALAINGIGLSADDAGDKIGILINKKWSSSDIKQFLNDAANLSKVGTGKMSDQIGRVVDVANGTGWNTPEQLRQLLAIERLGAAEVGDTGVSSAAMQEWYSALQSNDKRTILRTNGVEPFIKGTNKLRDPMELFLEMGKRAQFADNHISDIVGGNFSTLMQSFKGSERQAKLKNSVGSHNNNLLEEKAKANSQTVDGDINKLKGYAGYVSSAATDNPALGVALAVDTLLPGGSGRLLHGLLSQVKDSSNQRKTKEANKVSGEISIHVSSDNNLTVKPVDVKSSGFNLSVDTGSTGNGAY